MSLYSFGPSVLYLLCLDGCPPRGRWFAWWKTLVYRRTQLNCGTNETDGVLPGMLCNIWPDLHRQWQGLCCFPTGGDPYHTIKPVRCQLKAADICAIMGSILVHLSLSWRQGNFGSYAAANMWRRLLLYPDDQFPLALLEAILQQFKRKPGLILINVHRQAVGLCGCCHFGHEIWAWEQFKRFKKPKLHTWPHKSGTVRCSPEKASSSNIAII